MMSCSERVTHQLLTAVLVLYAAQMVTTFSYKYCSLGFRKDHFICLHQWEGNVSEILADLPPSTIRIQISRSPLKQIPDGSFLHLSNLTTLILDQNNITTLGHLAFKNLHQLQILNLTSNNISSLHSLQFIDLQNLRILTLAQNKIKVLPGNIFATILKLKTLILEENQLSNFSQITASVSHLPSLETMKLSMNKLSSIKHSNASLPKSMLNLDVSRNNMSSLGCHQSFLSHLNTLNVSFNPRLSTEAFQGVDLSQLLNLSLQNTTVNITEFLITSNIKANHVDYSGTGLSNDSRLEEFCKVLGKKVENMTHFRLLSNGIVRLSSTSLQHCPKHIEILDLSWNKLNQSQCLLFLNHTNNLRVFKAEHNALTVLESCKGKDLAIFKNLTYLSYQFNRIHTIDNNAFDHMPNLIYLNLNMNGIAWFGNRVLSGLHNLKNLRLDDNRLNDLFRQTFQNLSNLETLNLRSNVVSVIFSYTFSNLRSLKTLDLGENKITHIEKRGLHGLTSLTHLFLDGNKLKIIDPSIYYPVSEKLEVLNLDSNQIMYNHQTSFSPFQNLSQLTELHLSSQQPYGLVLLPINFFYGLHSLKKLQLKNNRIARLGQNAFDDLTQLKMLYLDFCCVASIHIQPGLFKNLRNLTHLWVENIGLQNFSKVVFGNLTKLQSLFLNRNGMHNIDVEILESFHSLTYMDIRGNPLRCNCENSQLQNWTVNNPKVQVVHLFDLFCPEDSKIKFTKFDSTVCYVDIGQYLCFSTAALNIIFIIIPIVFAKLYWTFKYTYFVFRAWFSEQWRRLRDEEENCKYDAFISYNSSDEQWVYHKLVPNLEGNGSSFKLCLHHRDFEVGRNIVDNIVSAVYNSRKTICVVSRNFLQSEWCSLEIQLASYRLFDEHRDVLLLIFLENITERQMSSYHRMRKVMLKKTYLQWPGSDCADPVQAQKLFWSQLRRAMKSHSQCESDLCESERSHHRALHSERETADQTQYFLP